MIIFGLIMGFLITLVTYISYIFVIAFTLWMAIDAGKQDRFWWIALIIGIPFIGSVVYYFTEKKHEYAKIEPHHIHDSETEQQHEITPHTLAHHKKHQTEDIHPKGESTEESVVKESGEHLAVADDKEVK